MCHYILRSPRSLLYIPFTTDTGHKNSTTTMDHPLDTDSTYEEVITAAGISELPQQGPIFTPSPPEPEEHQKAKAEEHLDKIDQDPAPWLITSADELSLSNEESWTEQDDVYEIGDVLEVNMNSIILPDLPRHYPTKVQGHLQRRQHALCIQLAGTRLSVRTRLQRSKRWIVEAALVRYGSDGGEIGFSWIDKRR